MAAVMALKPAQIPMALPRSAGGKPALISARLPGTSKAAPISCKPLATTSHKIAGVGAVIPGLISVTVSGVIRAGGAIALFVIVFWFNPPKLIAE